MFEYFYNEILRRTIISFGTLFNGITVKQDGGDIRVPLAYGPTQKFLARLDQVPDPTNKRVQLTLPRISFEINGLEYDSSRKVSPTQKIKIASTADKKKLTDAENNFFAAVYKVRFGEEPDFKKTWKKQLNNALSDNEKKAALTGKRGTLRETRDKVYPDNIFFKNNKLSGVIDFYFAANDYFMYEIAICVNALCFKKRNNKYILDKKKSANLLKGYEGIRKLTSSEKKNFNTMCKGSALRYLLTRAYDYLNTPKNAIIKKKNPREYLDKLNFHKTVNKFSAYLR